MSEPAAPEFDHPWSMLEHAADTGGAATALVAGDRSLSYAALREAARAFAARLHATGLAGATLSLLVPGSIDLVVALFGGWRAGCRVALHNPGLTGGELERVWAIVQPAALVAEAATAAALAAGGTLLPPLLTVTGDADAPSLPPLAPVPAGTPILYLFSGGTTGVPKAVAHGAPQLMHAVRAMHAGWDIELDRETWLSISPQFHVYGLLFALLNPVHARARNILCYPFKPAEALASLRTERATVYSGGPPAVYEALLAAAGDSPLDLPQLRVCAGGGAAFPLDLLERWRRRGGPSITEAMGMTEMAPLTANAGAGGNRPGTIGRPATGVELQVRDPGDGSVLGPGSDGMIVARGPHLMLGYAGDPDETARAVVDGWLITGDIGRCDDNGFFTITGRLKEMISVSGFKVYPREIEAAATAHAGVAEACAIGVPDARSGEAPVLYVVDRNGDGERLGRELPPVLEAQLARYKRPKAIVTIAAIPRTAADKPDRRALQALWSGANQAAG